jgi:hypothetical protein
LSPEARYLGAWQEINQRLSIRGQINTYHISAIIALAAAYVTIDKSDSSHGVRLIPAVLMPFTSTVFVLWYRHNDTIIGLLSLYCRTLERMDFKVNRRIPAWFYAPPKPDHVQDFAGIQTQALGARKLSDFATGMICAISPILMLNEVRRIFATSPLSPSELNTLYLIFMAFSSVSCTILVIWLYILPGRRRSILEKTVYDHRIGLWSVGKDDIFTRAALKSFELFDRFLTKIGVRRG